MSFGETLQNTLVDLGIAQADVLLGCQDFHLWESQHHQGVAYLPKRYAQAMRAIGRRAGPYLYARGCCLFPEVRTHKTVLEALLAADNAGRARDHEARFTLPADAFVFGQTRGFQGDTTWLYFRTDDPDSRSRDDPPVYSYAWRQDGSQRRYKHLSDYFVDTLAQITGSPLRRKLVALGIPDGVPLVGLRRAEIAALMTAQSVQWLPADYRVFLEEMGYHAGLLWADAESGQPPLFAGDLLPSLKTRAELLLWSLGGPLADCAPKLADATFVFMLRADPPTVYSFLTDPQDPAVYQCTPDAPTPRRIARSFSAFAEQEVQRLATGHYAARCAALPDLMV